MQIGNFVCTVELGIDSFQNLQLSLIIDSLLNKKAAEFFEAPLWLWNILCSLQVRVKAKYTSLQVLVCK